MVRYDLAFYYFNSAVFKFKLSWILLSDLATLVVTFMALCWSQPLTANKDDDISKGIPKPLDRPIVAGCSVGRKMALRVVS